MIQGLILPIRNESDTKSDNSEKYGSYSREESVNVLERNDQTQNAVVCKVPKTILFSGIIVFTVCWIGFLVAVAEESVARFVSFGILAVLGFSVFALTFPFVAGPHACVKAEAKQQYQNDYAEKNIPNPLREVSGWVRETPSRQNQDSREQGPKRKVHSAAFNRGPGDIRVLAVVIPELELGNIEREIFFADLVESSDRRALSRVGKPVGGL
jgi:hypothetical protein